MAYKLISLLKIPSTQTHALQMIATGHGTDRTIVMANVQTDGRGRYKRTWISPAGNLYVSFIFKIPERDPKLSYTVAVAIADFLMSKGANPQIKWPNDILIDGKKLSGVLIEYARDFVVVGIGINIKSRPKIAEYETAKLDDYIKIDRNELLSGLMKSLDTWMERDFFSVRERWTQMAAGLNKTITYRGQAAELMGLNEDGALVLRRGSEYVLTYGDEISI